MGETMTVEPIAIVGLGCRFPGASDPASFWQLLRQGKKAITSVPKERWERSHFYDPNPKAAGKMSSCEGGFLKDIDRFDAAFFGISDAEACHIDPQQRLFLEVAWEALEYAGIPPKSLGGSATGVFAGLCTIDYHRLLYRNFDAIGPHSGTGTTMSITANRLSYLLDLHGPSMAIDAACSSGLVGVHLACQSLRAKESNLCIAGGVNLILSPDSMISSSQTGLLSNAGECRPFDANADGYVRGEGCGAVVLKRLSDATAAGDTVLAVIKGSAVNQDGLSNSLSAPNGRSQQALITRALGVSGVSANDIDYIETHAVGTMLGDAIEFKALTKVLTDQSVARESKDGESADKQKSSQQREKPCLIGSLKPNIGHLEAASGIAALIKVVLALQHEEIPPQLNFEQANSYVSFKEGVAEIAPEGRPWTKGKTSRLAGVSTFGFGGTNAHMVVAEAPKLTTLCGQPNGERFHLFSISAKSPAALRSLAQRYCTVLSGDALDQSDPRSLSELCYTANTGRTHFKERLCIVAHSLAHLKQQLAEFVVSKPCSQGPSFRRPSSEYLVGQASGKKGPKVVFSFPELTPSTLNDTLALGEVLYQAQPAFKAHFDRGAMLAGIEVSRIGDRADMSVGLLVYYAMSALWQSWGIQPQAVTGKGNGEFIAACVAGLLDFGEVLQGSLSKQGLLQNYSELTFTLPRLPIVSNHYSSLLLVAQSALLETSLETQSHRTEDKKHSHSKQLDKKQLDKKLPITGLIGYDFALGIGSAVPCSSYQEKTTPIEAAPLVIQSQGTPVEDDVQRQLLTHLGKLFVRGAVVDWSALYHGKSYRKRALPTYPFERKSYWFSQVPSQAPSQAPTAALQPEPLTQTQSEKTTPVTLNER
ncbi:MAG: type I polyketide synthase [Cyanobacteria bacterium J06597_16]